MFNSDFDLFVQRRKKIPPAHIIRYFGPWIWIGNECKWHWGEKETTIMTAALFGISQQKTLVIKVSWNTFWNTIFSNFTLRTNRRSQKEKFYFNFDQNLFRLSFLFSFTNILFKICTAVAFFQMQGKSYIKKSAILTFFRSLFPPHRHWWSLNWKRCAKKKLPREKARYLNKENRS